MYRFGRDKVQFMRKMRVFILTAVAIMMFSVPVFAREKFRFELTTVEEEGDSVAFSDNVEKTDWDDYAVVNYNAHSQYSGLRFVTVEQQGNDDEYVTESVDANAWSGEYRMSYTTDYYEGNYYRLRADIYRYSALVEGNWAP